MRVLRLVAVNSVTAQEKKKKEHGYINGYKNAFERVSYFKIYISCPRKIRKMTLPSHLPLPLLQRWIARGPLLEYP